MKQDNVNTYEAPKVEEVLSAEDIEREVLYAGVSTVPA